MNSEDHHINSVAVYYYHLLLFVILNSKKEGRDAYLGIILATCSCFLHQRENELI